MEDHPPLTAENGAKFEATIQHTSEGPQAHWIVSLDYGEGTLTQTDLRLFEQEPQAIEWIETAAMARGFHRYSLRHEDENGNLIMPQRK